MTRRVPASRIVLLNDRPVAAGGRFVLYWMIAARRTRWNFALERAAEWSRDLGLPLLILEALRADYRWASDRLHRFVLDGMAANARALDGRRLTYYPYVEPAVGHGRGLLRALAAEAAVVITDEFPCFMLPRMTAAAARQIAVRCEAVDGNGLLPLRAADGRVFSTAYSFRRFLQRHLPSHLAQQPRPHPLQGAPMPPPIAIPDAIRRRWPPAADALLADPSRLLATLPLDHRVGPVARRGGQDAAARALQRFVALGLPRYLSHRNDLDDPAASGLSPYLHFGHLGAHEVLAAVTGRVDWPAPGGFGRPTGRRAGWWNLPAPVESFVDQLVTWRELGFNMTFGEPAYDRYESLPEWARSTLEDHAGDRRAYCYSPEAFAAAQTHDPLWNAAQRELTRDGVIHNYLRMLWGKKILEWTRDPQEALEVMVELNNRYALDGRDPNSYSGIFWILGRYDRAWGPERPVFGKVRYMSSASTARKLSVAGYLASHAAAAADDG